jgi:hypothetical protein
MTKQNTSYISVVVGNNEDEIPCQMDNSHFDPVAYKQYFWKSEADSL